MINFLCFIHAVYEKGKYFLFPRDLQAVGKWFSLCTDSSLSWFHCFLGSQDHLLKLNTMWIIDSTLTILGVWDLWVLLLLCFIKGQDLGPFYYWLDKPNLPPYNQDFMWRGEKEGSRVSWQLPYDIKFFIVPLDTLLPWAQGSDQSCLQGDRMWCWLII